MKKLSMLLFVALIGCNAAQGPDPVLAQNKAAVRDYIERLVNQRDWQAWPELIAGDTLRFNGQAMTRGELRQMVDAFRTIMPDMQIRVGEQIAEGDVVASRVTITAVPEPASAGLCLLGGFGLVAWARGGRR